MMWVVVVVVYVERAEFGQDSTRRGVRGKIGLDERSELRRAFRTASNDLRTCWRWTRTRLTEPTDDALRNKREGENEISTVLRACPPFGRGFVYIQVAFAENYAVPTVAQPHRTHHASSNHLEEQLPHSNRSTPTCHGYASRRSSAACRRAHRPLPSSSCPRAGRTVLRTGGC